MYICISPCLSFCLTLSLSLSLSFSLFFQHLLSSMKAIETFSYEKYSTEDPDALPFIQDAVIDSKQVEDQLTLFTCVRGQEQCIIETMLM